MKKTGFMRAALLLLVLTLITSCFVGGTFAKYTTSTTGSDSARVAYWGFDQAASTEIKLFDKNYTNVVSGNGENIVAPGTSKSSTFAFGYTDNTGKNIAAPEVAYTLEVNAAAEGSYTALDANPNFKWTLKKGDAAAAEYNTVAELVEAVKKLSGDASGSKEYKAGQLPEAFTSADDVYTIGWEWKFETAGDGMAAQDATDTAMGNADDLDNIKLTITITATQID